MTLSSVNTETLLKKCSFSWPRRWKFASELHKYSSEQAEKNSLFVINQKRNLGRQLPCDLVILMKKSSLAPSYRNYARARLYYLFDRGGLLIICNPELELFPSIHLYWGTSLCLRAFQSQKKTFPESFESKCYLGKNNLFLILLT